MYNSYKINIDEISVLLNDDYSYYLNKGKNLFKPYEYKLNKTLNSFSLNKGIIDGKFVEENWFPTIDADIFISHSHTDEEEIVALAGWLDEIGLKVFIDSKLWGYADKLLNIIDKEKCSNYIGNYNYKKRNKSTAIVHMMLSTALTKMINQSECFIFIESENSITESTIIEDYTYSPWIYSELLISNVIQRKKSRTRFFDSSNENLNESGDPFIKLPAQTEHLYKINNSLLNYWKSSVENSPNSIHSLDVLYDIILKKSRKIL